MKIDANLHVQPEPGVEENCNKTDFGHFGFKNEISLISNYNIGV